MNNLRLSFELIMNNRYPKWQTSMVQCEVDEMYHFYCSGFVQANDNLVSFVSASAIVNKK